MSLRPIYLTIVSVKLFFKLSFMLVKSNQNLKKLTNFCFVMNKHVCTSNKSNYRFSEVVFQVMIHVG